jgi:hypothetical protein
MVAKVSQCVFIMWHLLCRPPVHHNFIIALKEKDIRVRKELCYFFGFSEVLRQVDQARIDANERTDASTSLQEDAPSS